MSTDYKKLGLKSGIEIHQRLDTKHKLFCNCSASFKEKPNSNEIIRKLRPVAGETGEVDIAAQHEAFAKKYFVYKTYKTESCLIDSDSEPPTNVNPEALEIATEIALLLNCKIVDEIHVMRKSVIDGSNTTGFQRTMLIGTNGYIETSFGKVGITAVQLEEESSQIIKKEKEKTTFGLTRLGIPLVEIATDPDIKTPEQGKEVAEKLGMILRSSRSSRGIGTIRQDLNVSISKGVRTEIKGVQDLKGIPKLIESEIERQISLIKRGQEIKKTVRRANPDGSTTFLRPLPGAARLYPETDCLPLKIKTDFVSSISKNLPQLLEDKHKQLTKKLGIDNSLLKALEKSGKLDLLRRISLKNIKTQFIAKTLLSYKTDVKNKNQKANPDLVKDNDFLTIFQKLDKKEISKDSVIDILTELSLGKKPDFAKYKPQSVSNLDKEVEQLVKSKPGLSFGAYMGILMGKYRGKVSGDDISKALKKVLK